MLKLGLPKGRLHDAAQQWLQKQNVPARSILVKPRAIPQLLHLRLLDIGIVGKDIWAESQYITLESLGTLPVKETRLVIAAKDPELLTKDYSRPLRMASEYPELAAQWAYSKGLAVTLLQTYGTTEMYAAEGFADLVLDTVESGATLREYGLIELETLLVSGVHILVHRETLSNKDFAPWIQALRSTSKRLQKTNIKNYLW